MISKRSIERIFDIAQIEEVIGDFVDLKKRGVNYIGLCPFHNEKTPSFIVSPAKGIYKCFGCGASGNAVKFVMEHEKLSYPEALKFLAQKYHIEIEETAQNAEEKAKESKRESLLAVVQFAQKHFAHNLFYSDMGKTIGLSYLKERGFRTDIIEKFQLGYAIDEWTYFTDAAIKNKYKLSFLEESGLTIVKENNKKFDRFKGRVIFPIHSVSGRVIAFGGRILKNDKKTAKYLNSPESEIYHKSDVLYGIYFSKNTITEQNNCYMVEGYTDVISLYQSGIKNVAASSGTSLTEGQIRLLKRYTDTITFLYDGDAAGIKASFRGIDMVLEQGLNVKVLAFPNGEDPDSFSKSVSNTELKQYIETETTDFITFKTKHLISEVGNDPIKKARLITDIVNSIAAIPNSIKRSLFIKQCSDIMQIDEPVLYIELNKILRKKLYKSKETTTTPPRSADSSANEPEKLKTEKISLKQINNEELEVIRVLLNYYDKKIYFDFINEDEHEDIFEITVGEFIIDELENDKIQFNNTIINKIYNIFKTIKEEKKTFNLFQFTHNEDNEIASFSIDIISSPYTLSENWEKKYDVYTETEDLQLKKVAESTIYKIKLKKINEMLKATIQKLKEAGDNPEQIPILLEKQIRLEAIRNQIAKKLGRIILY